MVDIVATTLNPSIDILTSVLRIEPGHKLRCAPPLVYPGGGAVNVARMARLCGAKVELICAAGGAAGERLGWLLDAEGVSWERIFVEGETREDLTVIDAETADEYRFIFPGPTLQPLEWEEVLAAVRGVRAADFVVGSGSLPTGVPDDYYATLADIAAEIGAKFVLDTSGVPLMRSLGKKIFLLKPNLRELCELTGTKLGDHRSIVAGCRALLNDYQLERIAVSLGKDGAILVDANVAFHAAAPAIKVHTTVGAGDAFLGALIAELVKQRPMQDALVTAVAAGSVVVSAPSKEISLQQVKSSASNVTVETI